MQLLDLIRLDNELLPLLPHLALLLAHLIPHLLIMLLQRRLLYLYLSILALDSPEVAAEFLGDLPGLLELLLERLHSLLSYQLLTTQLRDLLVLLRLLQPHLIRLQPVLLDLLLLIF